MKRVMSIEYLMCGADLNFEDYFGVNGAMCTIMTKRDLILIGKRIVFIHNIIFLKDTHQVSLSYCVFDTRTKQCLSVGGTLFQHSLP